MLDANGMPTSYPLYQRRPDRRGRRPADAGLRRRHASDPASACGDFAVNTVQPSSPPHGPSGPKIPLIDDAQYPNIGDRLTRQGHLLELVLRRLGRRRPPVTPGPLFQYHHQPFNYFANYAPGQPGRTHLKDETDFFTAARTGHLPTVSFVKPYGAENEHPGYASEPHGSDHLVKLLQEIRRARRPTSTLVVVTYDEFGGQWDHVPPPGPGSRDRGRARRRWGPGTRIPALVLSTSLRRSGVDHTVYDTTSILATIERSFGLAPLSSRDAGCTTCGTRSRWGAADRPAARRRETRA